MNEGARHSERGGVLIVALLIAATLSLLGAGLLASSLNSTRVASNEQASARAFSIAEAGIERGRVALGAMNLNAALAGGGNLLTNQALDAGSYSAVVTNNLGPRFPLGTIAADTGGATTDTDRVVLLTATGTMGNAQRRIEVVLRRLNTNFGYAVWTATSASFAGSSSTNSWDSSTGTYAATVGSNGDVFSNGSMTMASASMINGDADVGGAIPATHVSGTVTTGVPSQTMANASCPVGYTAAANLSGSGYTYNAATGVLNVGGSGNVTVTAPPNVLSFSNVTMGGSSTLTINSGGNHVDMYVSDVLSYGGSAMSNPSAMPTLLTIRACGASTSAWTISGGTDAYWAIYAPTRDVTVSGSADIYGAIVANTVTSGGGSAIHYDQALNNGPFAAITGGWAEIYQ